jgi:hypothetical protein
MNPWIGELNCKLQKNVLPNSSKLRNKILPPTHSMFQGFNTKCPWNLITIYGSEGVSKWSKFDDKRLDSYTLLDCRHIFLSRSKTTSTQYYNNIVVEDNKTTKWSSAMCLMHDCGGDATHMLIQMNMHACYLKKSISYTNGPYRILSIYHIHSIWLFIHRLP